MLDLTFVKPHEQRSNSRYSRNSKQSVLLARGHFGAALTHLQRRLIRLSASGVGHAQTCIVRFFFFFFLFTHLKAVRRCVSLLLLMFLFLMYWSVTVCDSDCILCTCLRVFHWKWAQAQSQGAHWSLSFNIAYLLLHNLMWFVGICLFIFPWYSCTVHTEDKANQRHITCMTGYLWWLPVIFWISVFEVEQ